MKVHILKIVTTSIQYYSTAIQFWIKNRIHFKNLSDKIATFNLGTQYHKHNICAQQIIINISTPLSIQPVPSCHEMW